MEFLLLKADGFSWFIIQASVHLTGSQRWDQFISIERVCVLTGACVWESAKSLWLHCEFQLSDVETGNVLRTCVISSEINLG